MMVARACSVRPHVLGLWQSLELESRNITCAPTRTHSIAYRNVIESVYASTGRGQALPFSEVRLFILRIGVYVYKVKTAKILGVYADVPLKPTQVESNYYEYNKYNLLGPTETPPKQTVCNPILWLVRIWDHPFGNVQCLRLVTLISSRRATIVNVQMPSHIPADHIAHHGSAIVA